jgi:hypothetical protein
MEEEHVRTDASFLDSAAAIVADTDAGTPRQMSAACAMLREDRPTDRGTDGILRKIFRKHHNVKHCLDFSFVFSAPLPA